MDRNTGKEAQKEAQKETQKKAKKEAETAAAAARPAGATSVQIVLPQHCNGYEIPRLFGGQIMSWIDIVGAVAARRFTGTNVTTVCIDNLTFLSPAYLNDTVVQEARVTWSGNTSLEVRVESFVESLDGARSLINRAYVVYVALGADDRPVRIGQSFVPETAEEKAEYAAAAERRKRRMAKG